MVKGLIIFNPNQSHSIVDLDDINKDFWDWETIYFQKLFNSPNFLASKGSCFGRNDSVLVFFWGSPDDKCNPIGTVFAGQQVNGKIAFIKYQKGVVSPITQKDINFILHY